MLSIIRGEYERIYDLPFNAFWKFPSSYLLGDTISELSIASGIRKHRSTRYILVSYIELNF